MSKNIEAAFRQTSLRMALCLALMLCVAVSGGAQTIPSPPTVGDGSAGNPYQISEKAHLLWLAQSNTGSRWAKHYIQTEDINMAGETLANPIGVSGTSTPPGFTGSYNGQNHVIRNLNMKWTNSPISVGLFGYVKGGTLKNIIIDGATIEVDKNSVSGTNDDFKVGILAGAISPNGTNDVTIENIYVRNSKIQEPEGTTDNINIKSAFVGGVVGDLTVSWGTFTAIGDRVHLSNIYSDVDIDLQNVVQSSFHQFNIGGVIGRVRFGTPSCFPTNSVFTGNIKAPNATVGPIVGAARVEGDAYGDKLAQSYAGQLQVSGTNRFLSEAEQMAFNKSNIFENYYVYDNKNKTYVDASTITTGYDVTYGGNTVHVNTLDGTTPQHTAINNTNNQLASIMRSFQGVNLGASDVIKDWMLDCNTDNYDSMSQLWDYDNLNWTTTKPDKPTQTVSVEQTDAMTFTASTDVTGCKYKWYYIDKYGRKTYIPTTDDATLTYLFPATSTAKTMIVYLAETDGEKKVVNNQVIKAECGITVSEYTVDFAVSFDNNTKRTTILPTIKNASDEVLTGYTFDITLTSNDGTTKKFENVTADEGLTLSALACEVSVYIEARSSSSTNAVPSMPKKLNYHVTLSKQTSSFRTSGAEGYEFKFKDQIHFIDDANKEISIPISQLASNQLTVEWHYQSADGSGKTAISATPNEETNTFSFLIDNTSFVSRDIVLTCTDAYGFKSSLEYRGELPKTSGFVIENDAAVHTKYWLNFLQYNGIHNSDVVGRSIEKFIINGVEYTPAELKDYDDYNAYHVPVRFSDQTLSASAIDRYGYQQEFEPVTVPPVEPYIEQDGNTVKPKFVRIPDDYSGLEGLTYSWQVEYEDGTSETKTTKEFEISKNATVTLTVTDPDGATATVILPVTMLYDTSIRMDVNKSGNVLTATLTSPETIGAGTWKWYGVSGDIANGTAAYTELPGTTNSLTYTGDEYPAIRAVWTETATGRRVEGYWAKKNVIFVFDKETSIEIKKEQFFHDNRNNLTFFDERSYPVGSDDNHGRSPLKAVKTMKRAYELCAAWSEAERTTVDDNIIVIMGICNDKEYLTSDVTKPDFSRDDYRKPVTITSRYEGVDYKGYLAFGGDKTGGRYTRYLANPLKIEYLSLFANSLLESNFSDQSRINCNMYDLHIAKGVKVLNFIAINSKNYGLIVNDTLPNFDIVGGMVDWNQNINDFESLTQRPCNAVPNVATIKIESGCFSRIVCSARNQNVNSTSHNIFGSPTRPQRIKLIVDIKHDDEQNPFKEYAPLNGYTKDIGLIAGGQCDGAVYADIMMTLNNGHIGRYISGNIAAGRNVGLYPTDSFFGSTQLDVHGGSISELFGGSLGRFNQAEGKDINPYFYGKSVLNLYGGVINSDIYGAGAGGTSGLHHRIDDDLGHYTEDKFIPYYATEADLNANNIANLKYGDYAAVKAAMLSGAGMPNMVLQNGTTINLSDTEAKVHVKGATIKGSIFGGGYGYSTSMTGHEELALPQAGYFFGSTEVVIEESEDEGEHTTVEGDVYGGSRGSRLYYDAVKVLAEKATEEKNKAKLEALRDKLKSVAQVFGHTRVLLSGGYIGGDVFGGSVGDVSFPTMATVYGDTYITLDGAEVNGNIYGGCDFASIRKEEKKDENGMPVIVDGKPVTIGGNINVEINSGIVGNNIFGGSRGSDGTDKDGNGNIIPASTTEIDGNTYVTVTGGDWLGTPYINRTDKTDGYRSFNIYGGGNKKCDVLGDTYMNVTSSLMSNAQPHLFLTIAENPNADEKDNHTEFQSAYMDLTYRRFSIYGGGFGEQTNCMNTHVTVNTPARLKDSDGNEFNATLPHGNTLDSFLDHQSFFDIAGGGYSGDIGYWAKADGTPVAADSPVSDYDHYEGGDCNVIIDGYTYCRKVIGGGFYGSCNNTNTKVRCGSLRQVYGGSLLGYVHGRAKLEIGNNAEAEDFIAECGSAAAAKAKAKELNDLIYITENVYGGNDVKGIVGTTPWVSRVGGEYGKDREDEGPLWMSDTTNTEHKGVVMNIYGGRFMCDVYGAGNGHYRGYYVPGWLRYEDGPARMYRDVRGIDGTTYEEDLAAHPTEDINVIKTRHRVYRARPMVGSVNINIRGNSEDDFVKIDGNFYGGGRECTIGQWRTILPFEDPRRLSQGGYLHVNMGGNIYLGYEDDASTIKKLFPDRDDHGNFYMGVEGRLYAKPEAVPSGIDLSTFDGSTTRELNKLKDSAYDHWYFNSEGTNTHNGVTSQGRYEPGFPANGKLDGNFKMTGKHMFRGYMKNIEMQGDVELTFYRDLYTHWRKEDGVSKQYVDSTKRRRWVPGEIAVGPKGKYDAKNITMNSFFLGGKCGSMTNNNVMIFCYKDSIPTTVTSDNSSTHDHESFGSIYRITMPQGVTIKNLLVMGAEDATIKYGDYVFEGGMVTQSAYSFDYIAYNLYMMGLIKEAPHALNLKFNNVVRVPDDFYEASQYATLRTADELTVMKVNDDNTLSDDFKIYRKYYESGAGDMTASEHGVTEKRFGLAVKRDADGEYAYFGGREYRKSDGGTDEGSNHLTVSKLTAGCKFDPQVGKIEGEYKGGYTYKSDKRFGGIIYGGCYNSGVIMGDVIMNVGSNMLGDTITKAVPKNLFTELSTLRHYVGRIYGGGYGVDSRVDGNVYVNLVHNIKAMNVFGGGMLGGVTGDSHINYIGNDSSYVYGAIYGGGFQGSVGRYYWRHNSDYQRVYDYDKFSSEAEATTAGYHRYVKKSGTYLNIISGNVDHVYGGSCMGDIYGATDVKLYDEVTKEINLDHLDYKRLVGYHNDVGDWGTARLVVGTVFGGNDISGNIIHTKDTYQQDLDVNDTNVEVKEVQYTASTPSGGSSSSSGPAKANEKDSPGAANGYNGFPLVGSLYGGSNGDYGTHGEGTNYASGEFEYATGVNNATAFKDLTQFSVPHVEYSSIKIKGGTIVNAYGGGDMSTVTKRDSIQIEYNADNLSARAGFDKWSDVMRVWHVCHLTSDEQINEVLTYDIDASAPTDPNKRTNCVFRNQVYRVFGGNNNADMDIQPTWVLTRGFIGNVYSGGNFGKMTYFDGVNDKGLQLTINSPQLHAESVYGGGRVGDIAPAVPTTFDVGGNQMQLPDDFYGATLHIIAGVIDNVYGGNDVSGVVEHGTHVILEGAISGDVYCAGNGNHRYLYDVDGTLITNTHNKIDESYSDEYGGRYFILPKKIDYIDNNDEPVYFSNSGLDKIRAINSYRPNVTRAYMEIKGSADNVVYVRGNAYCGGNSAAVAVEATDGELNDIKFEIGNHVRLNSVFLGSNGEALMTTEMISATEKLNGIDLSTESGLTGDDALLYPNLLDVYMQAVESKGIPSDFKLDTATDAYIGDFFLGGNRGSMMTDRRIKLEFPENLVVYGKIVGGSQNANVEYTGKSGKTVKHIGGLNKKLAKKDKNNNPILVDGKEPTDKVKLTIKSKFEPWRMDYPKDGDIFSIQLKADVNRKYTEPSFSRWRCNIYGGCFNSGRTVGNVSIDLYSDLTGDYSATSDIGKALVDSGLVAKNGMVSKKQWIVNGINREGDDQHRTFSLIGGGYGEDTDVYGDIHLRLMPTDGGSHHPSAATVFGGSQDGRVVGNTLVELRDGTVLTNLYGASEATPLYGSSQIIIGWPDYYKATRNGTYIYNKVDKESDYHDKLKNQVSFRKGDIVSKRVYDAITDSVYNGAKVTLSAADKAAVFTLVDDERPTTAQWNNIDIHVGDNASLDDPTATYYGHGNVYGGGFISQKSATGELGSYTVRKFPAENTEAYNKLSETYQYEGFGDEPWGGLGGNSMIIVWDNSQNATVGEWHDAHDEYAGGHYTNTGTLEVKDHISIGTGYFKPVTLKNGQDVLNYYKRVTHGEHTHFVQQSSHRYGGESDQYYEIVSDGGIYGDGRMVYVEGLRACDIAYYGYAGSRPQYPKMLNTFQRLDLLSVTDCCLRLEGAQDIVTNGNSNPTKYSLTRIGELQMFSSLKLDEPLDGGTRLKNDLYKVEHDKPRIRNYMAFGHGALYLGAIKSNVDFTSPFHYPDGKLTSTEDEIDYKLATGATLTYEKFKQKRINDYYLLDANGHIQIDSDGKSYKKNPEAQTAFDQRNMGTAANMIGINNGYSLHIQGLYEDAVSKTATKYAGPAVGVFEVKLLTLTFDEGGGYIYALNKHNHADGDTRYNFFETPGNFIYAGAAYEQELNKDVSQLTLDDVNYIYDDCVPMGRFDKMTNPNTEAIDHEHVWYVNGSTFFFNASLTAYTSENPETFLLDDISRDIYLYRVAPNQKISIEGIMWTESQNVDSDIQNYHSTDSVGKGYSLYVSVGDDKEHAHSSAHSADFVSKVSRSDYVPGTAPLDLDVNYESATPPTTLSQLQVHSDGENQPYLGITLVDNVDNSARKYFDQHLAKPEKVRITIRAEEKDGDGNTLVLSHYNIDLDIYYMLSPIIKGNIVIENGALPGEYIFANAFDVTIEKDDNILISGYDWYIAPGGLEQYKNEGMLVASSVNSAIDAGKITKIENPDWKFSATEYRQLHIPAARYMDKWGLIYGIHVGQNTYYRIPATHPDSLNKIPGKPYKPCLVVHNYHRMLPTKEPVRDLDCYAEDLKITAGARIYIEDNVDMAYFYKWLAGLQNAPTRTTENGQHIDPQYGDSLSVFLMNDVTLPAGLATTYGSAFDTMKFKGTFHGDGHSINMNGNDCFLKTNYGKIRNTGFIFNKAYADSVKAFVFNKDTIQNSFYYNIATGEGRIFRNNDSIAFAKDEFRYGKAAYDLNGYYLEKRQTAPAMSIVGIVDSIYHDGEYRFALVSEEGAEPTALRRYKAKDLTKNSTPNYLSKRYRDRLDMAIEDYGDVTGFDVTMHNDLDLVDMSRAIYKVEDGVKVYNGYYEAIFDKDKQDRTMVKSDYHFFGQNIGADVYPYAIEVKDSKTDKLDDGSMTYRAIPIDDYISTNRVHRAGGFYGSMYDKGFHFNRAAKALQPTLTAINFNEDNPETVAADAYLPPIPDMPADGLTSFWIDNNAGITHNLLVYDDGTVPFTDASIKKDHADSDESDINVHVIDVNCKIEQFHLVDKNDFNAPIPFDVTKRAWYEREPLHYATRVSETDADGFTVSKNAWEGISLPFVANRTYAVSSPDSEVDDDRGLISHFYGSDPDRGITHHDYWLRGLVDTNKDSYEGDDVIAAAGFARPGSGSGLFDLGANQPTGDYDYFNDWFYTTYRNVDYVQQHDEYADTLKFFDYCYQTKNAPYIVAFPGEDYKEFDLSGEFYKDRLGVLNRQSIVYEFNVDSIDNGYNYESTTSARINVTDQEASMRKTSVPDNSATPSTHNGIFQKIAFDWSDDEADDNYYVLNETAVTVNVKGENVTLKPGMAFINCKDFEIDEILPFRTYLTVPWPNTSAAKRFVMVGDGTRGLDSMGSQGEEEQNPAYEGVHIYVKDGNLIVTSDRDFTLPLYGISGILNRNLPVYAGKNVYRNLNSGVYIALGKKFAIAKRSFKIQEY